MNRNALTGSRSAIVVVGLGLLLAACSAGVGGVASVPADSGAATPAAAAAGTAGAPATVAPSAAPASVPTTSPLAPSVGPAITLTTPSPLATRPAAPTLRPAAATPTPALEPSPALETPIPALSAAANRKVSEPDGGNSVAVPVGAEVTLVLHNIYWQVQGSSDPAVLALVSGPVASGAGPIACIPGTGCGTVTAVFRAIAPGRATITASRTSCGEALQCTGTAGAYEVTVVVGS